MTDPEIGPNEWIEPSTDSWTATDMARAQEAMFLMGNHPAKLATHLALTTFEPEEYVSKARLQRQVAALQEGNDGWTPKPQTLLTYCKDSMVPLGFVELGHTVSAHKKETEIESVRLTEKGRAIGSVVAGALLRLELQNLEHSTSDAHKASFLQDIIGKTFYKKGRLSGAPTRFAIYETLLALQVDEGLAQTELKSKTGLPHSTLVMLTQDLCHLDILYKEDDFNAKQTFTISPNLLDIDLNRLLTIETRTIVTAAMVLFQEGHTQVKGTDILERAQQMKPEFSRRRMNKLLIKWLAHPANTSLLQEVKLSKKPQYHTRIGIRNERRNYLQELMHIRRMLADNSDEARLFRATATRQAEMLLASPQDIARLMTQAQNKSRSHMPNTADWLDDLLSLIPPEGISTLELHRKVVERSGKDIVYRAFRDRLNRLQGQEIEITEDSTCNRPGISGFVTHRLGAVAQTVRSEPASTSQKHVFPENWADEAACLYVDPELFYPLGSRHSRVTEVAQRQAENAKRICDACTVLLPCLKSALDANETEAIRGGVWFRFKSNEISRQRIQFIQDIVEIK